MTQRQVEKIVLDDLEYEGETENGVIHGIGKAVFASGDTYEGEWRDEIIYGNGTYTWADGDQYVGDFVDEKQHGQGTLKDKNGTYSGSWVEDKREGFGKQCYVNGDVYEGEWSNGVKHGKGKLVRENGAVYEGQWFKDVHHGVGMSKNINGDIYEGEFLRGKPHGKGTYRWSDGSSYVGYFKDGLKHGEGCERLPNGNWVAGNWINGEHDKQQPIHKVDAGALAEQQRMLEETLSRLNFDIMKPLPIDQLKANSSPGNTVSTTSASIVTQPAVTTTSPNKAPHTPTGQNSPVMPGGLAASKEVVYSASDFENWQPMKLLGKGSFGAVYEAGLPSGQIVCVKIVELGAIAEAQELAKLENEISLMKRLHHPNIVRYYGCQEDKDKNTLNIFMEYVTGGSLNHYIKKFKTIPIETVRQWTYQIVMGVKYLHDSGIIHRDIKGDNVLVTMEGVLKMADFGCSKAIDDVCSKTHGCQTMVGTPYWMAPEVIKCEGYGFKSDIWSVGCTVVEMVTGKPPWPECNSMWAAVYKIANSTGLPTEIPKDLPKDMMEFLESTFQRDPSKRPSCEDLLRMSWLQF